MKLRIIFFAFVLSSLLFSGFYSNATEIAATDIQDAESTVYLFAHQDDEALIIAKIATDLHYGRKIYCIWITDGSGTADAALREQESRSVMKLAGVPEANLFFLGYEDRYSWKSLDDVYADVLKIINELSPVEITSNAYEGGNIDHDVASLIGTLVASQIDPPAVHHEFPLYNVYNGSYRVGKFIPYSGSEILYTPINKYLYDLKNDVLDLYPTQAAIIQTLKSIIDKKTLRKKGEPYRVAPHYDYSSRPVDEPLGYEANARNPVKFEDWQGAVIPFLERFDQ